MKHKLDTFAFVLGVTLVGPVAGAQVETSERTAVTPKDWQLSISASLSETPVDRKSADFFRYLGFSGLLTYTFSESSYEWFKTPSLLAKISWTDQMDYEDNESDLENSTLTLSGLGHGLGEHGTFSVPLTAVLPDNTDDRKYLGYRGSFLAKPSLAYTLGSWVASTGVGLNRSFYALDASQGGRYNPEWGFSPFVSLTYSHQWLKILATLSNTTTQLADGARAKDKYLASLALDVEHSPALSSSLSWTRRDKTFGYDGVAANVDFRFADKTLVSYELTYTL